MDFEFKWHVLIRYQSFLIDGVLITIQMALLGMSIALTLGLIIALMGKSGIKILEIFSDIYIQIFKKLYCRLSARILLPLTENRKPINNCNNCFIEFLR